MNKMGSMSINKLLINMSLPIMLALFIQALYNIVDSMFVANYSIEALDAVSVAFPVSMIIIALSVGSAIGMGAVLAKKLGEGKRDEASNIAMHGLFIAIMTWLILTIVVTLFSKQFFMSFSSDINIVNMAYDYSLICTVGGFGIFIQIMVERILQSTGNTVANLKMQIASALINVILDPILIFGFIFIPSLGIKGAAIATITGQIIGAIYGLNIVNKQVKEVNINIKEFKFNINTIKEIYSIGFSAILMQSVGTIMLIGVNYILAMESETAISVYGVYAKLQQFVFMPVYGLCNALVAIVAFNYGAKNQSRVKETIKYAVLMSLGIMMFGTILFQLFATNALSLYNATPEMYELGINALKIISFSFVFAGYCFIFGSVFQALGKGVLSLIVTLVRSIIIAIPVVYIMYIYYGIDAAWYGFIISEICGFVLVNIFLINVNKKIINKI